MISRQGERRGLSQLNPTANMLTHARRKQVAANIKPSGWKRFHSTDSTRVHNFSFVKMMAASDNFVCDVHHTIFAGGVATCRTHHFVFRTTNPFVFMQATVLPFPFKLRRLITVEF
jgi:hypothetical protein